MILTPKIVARIAAIGLLGVLLQLSFFSRVELFHVSPDILPALVVCLGPARRQPDRRRRRLLDRLLPRLPAGRGARRLLAGPAQHRLPGRPLPRALRDPQLAGAGPALHGPDPGRRARLRRDPAAARDRRPGQRADRPRPAAEERLRLLPRLADLPARAPRCCARPWSRSRRCSAGASRRCWGPEGDVPPLRRARPGDDQPAGAAHRPLRRRRRGSLREFSSSGSGCCRCSTAKSTSPKRRTTAPAPSGPAPRAARSSTATARCWSPTGPAWRCRSTRANCRPIRPNAGPSSRSLADLTHSTLRAVRKTMHEELKLAPAAPVTLRRDVGHYLVYYLQENQERFPGVEVQRVFVRDYPDGTLAAHILGNVGEISEEQLKEPRYQRPAAGRRDRPGRGRGHLRPLPARRARPDPGPGRRARRADARTGASSPSRRRRATTSSSRSTQNVQAAGEAALAERGLPGGFITMDVHTRRNPRPRLVPDLRTGLFTRPLTQSQVDETYRNPAAPLLDRAIAGLYPTGSTFKLITAIAALESGNLQLGEVIDDPASSIVGGQEFKNAGEAANGAGQPRRGARSLLGRLLLHARHTHVGHRRAAALGARARASAGPPASTCRAPTEGLLPSQHWRNQLYKEGGTDRPWSAGDNVQLATGQGDLQTNPLQMAVAYATLANGGTVVTPHVGKEIDDAAGRVLKEFDPKPRRHVQIDPEYRAAILEGLHDAAQNGGGTSFERLRQLPDPGCRQDRHRPAPGARGPVLVRRPRSLSQSAYRHLRYDGGRRLRRRIGRARAQGRFSKRISQARGRRQPVPTEGEARADVRDPRPPGPARALRSPSRHRRAPWPALHGRHSGLLRGRSRRLQRLHPGPGDKAGRPRQPLLLR